MILGIGKKKKAEKAVESQAKTPTEKGILKTALKAMPNLGKAAATKPSQAAKTTKAEARHEDYAVLLKPVITEKSTLVAANNQIVFRVATDSDKKTIKRAVERVFAVEVTAVNVIRQRGKVKRVRGIKGRRKDFKKAVVTLAKGYSIDLGMGV